MKSITKLVSSTIIFACASVQAEPVMNLITINTNDPAGYSAWAKGSAKALVKANNAMAMGLCSPTSGAQKWVITIFGLFLIRRPRYGQTIQ